MQEQLVKKADRFAGYTTVILLILGITQIILGEFFTKSIALTANGIDCIGDGFVSAVVWIGLMYFQKPANQRFNYGYYKMENLASGIAAVIMIGLAVYIAFRSYNQLINPHAIEAPIIGAIIAFIAAVIALALGFYKYVKSKKSKMSSVKLESLNTIKDGAASGLTVVALILSSQGIFIADGIAGLIIAVIIVSIGFASIKESSYMLIDACDGECIDRSSSIKQIAEEHREVRYAHIVRLRKSGPVFQGEMEIEVSEDMTIKEFNKIKKDIQNRIKEIFPEIERITITAITKNRI
ncbi:MAG: cation diffusion facilitator family transporter [Thermoplasmatales archaeon]|nr:MAG: cation diffusion facilitator family transporter [Thermoplasmatales archaeon]